MFRYVGALFVAALLSYLLTPFAIMLAKKFNVYDIPRERRVHKVPTPLLGGLAISVSFLVTTLAFGLIDRSVFGLFAGGILILVVGIIDDVVELKPSVKLLGQIAAAVVLVMSGIRAEFITNPFTKQMVFIGNWSIPITIIWVVAFTNIVNFMDGLDGLAASTGIPAFIACALIASMSGYIEVGIIAAAVAGALVGFLKYNKPKAEVFMGDTGSLAIGGLLGTLAVMGKFEFLLIFLAAVFVMETLSVIIQVASFKTTGKRVFKMAPVHHHFELCGWSEKKIVVVFAVVSLICSVIAFGLFELFIKGII